MITSQMGRNWKEKKEKHEKQPQKKHVENVDEMNAGCSFA